MSKHLPVMLTEVIQAFAPKNSGVYMDGTFGGGGHTKAILTQAKTSVIAFDKDKEALPRAHTLQQHFGSRLTFYHAPFSQAPTHIKAPVDGILIDLGVSSFQLDTPERGFSFQSDGPLDMRMDQSTSLTAEHIINTYKEQDIAHILYTYGDESYAKRIARRIVSARSKNPLTSTTDLASLIADCKKGYHKRHPATKSFQALRIYINGEMTELETFLKDVKHLIKPKGILAIISFHSLEDSYVKNFLRTACGALPRPSRYLPQVAPSQPQYFSHMKTCTPSQQEILVNPRARSARLRWATRI